MEDRNYTVYMHVNKSNGKKYVGITCQKPEKRWGLNGIGYEKHRAFGKAIDKYGFDNFIHIVLHKNLTKDEAAALEIKLIAEFKTNLGRGYNLTSGGEGMRGYSPTIETRKKLSKAFKGREINPEWRDKISKTLTGRKRPDEVIKKMSASAVGKVPWNKGLTGIYSDEVRVKMSEQAKARWENKEYRENIIKKNTGKKANEETRRKLSIANGGENNGFYGKRHSDETKKKISVGKKGQLPSNAKKVICLNDGKVFVSATQCANNYGIKQPTMSAWLAGKYKCTHQYTFMYYDDYIKQQTAI